MATAVNTGRHQFAQWCGAQEARHQLQWKCFERVMKENIHTI